MKSQEFTIRRTTTDDWQEVRDLRLEMIRDTPIAFGETLAQALAVDEAEWRERGARGTAEHGIALTAISTLGQWVGTMGGYIPNPDTGPLLVGVYVTPTWRGSQTGVTAALLACVEEWARAHGPQLTLDVHEDNLRARRFYEHKGYSITGSVRTYELDPSKKLLEMAKSF